MPFKPIILISFKTNLFSFLLLQLLKSFHHLYRLRSRVVKKHRFFRVQSSDCLLLVSAQLKINLLVCLHPLLLRASAQEDNSKVKQIPDDDIGNSRAVFFSYSAQSFVGENVVPPFGERTPGFCHDTVFLVPGPPLNFLVKGVHFYLVNHRLDFAVEAEVD